MSEKVYKDMPIEVGGLKICQKCYSYQVRGMEETKEKEEKPDFGELAFKGKKQKFKEEEKVELKPEFQGKLKVEAPKYPYLRSS
jgi:hypothetical protein